MLPFEDAPPEDELDTLSHQRVARYWAAASQKRHYSIGDKDQGAYYASLVSASENRSDPAAGKDRRQINKDLPRTFEGLAPVQGKEMASLLPLLYRILTAYIERGRSLSATGRNHTVGGINYDEKNSTATRLHSRGLLTGYPQGLNFLAGMSLLAAGATSWTTSSGNEGSLEQTAFWLLALLLEDVLDPDFFGADVKDNLQMAYIGGLGMRSLILQRAEAVCPILFDALGHEAFQSSLSAVLDQWVLSLFVGCAPCRLLEYLWDHLLLPLPGTRCHGHGETRADRSCPRGLAYTIAFSLAALRCCGDEKLGGTPVLERLRTLRLGGASPEDISLEAGEAVKKIRETLVTWPVEQDAHLLSSVSEILEEFVKSKGDADDLWNDVREQKQRIADFAGNYDDQLMALARRTHFTQGEIQRLRVEFERIAGAGDSKVDLQTFKEVVSQSVPEFPLELCGRLFDKLDAFCVGRLSFVELVCGMSALSLGTMDEKLQVCFDLFDSEGHRALTLKDLGDLCTVLFRVALAQGFRGAMKACTLEDIDDLEDVLHDSGALCEDDGRIGSRGRPNSNSPKRWRRARSSSKIEYPVVAATFAEGEVRRKTDTTAESSTRESMTQCSRQDDQTPWRSMLLRLLAAAQVRTSGGPLLVAFEDFRKAAHMEPALLCLFSWCLPRPPAVSDKSFHVSPGLWKQSNDGAEDVRRCCERCRCLFFWRRARRKMSLPEEGVELRSVKRKSAPLPVVTRGLPKASASHHRQL